MLQSPRCNETKIFYHYFKLFGVATAKESTIFSLRQGALHGQVSSVIWKYDQLPVAAQLVATNLSVHATAPTSM